MLKHKFGIAHIIISALIIRIAAIFVLGSPRAWEYEDIAQNILAGKGFIYPFGQWKYPHLATTEPMYPYLTSLVYAAMGRHRLAMVAVQIIISVLLILIIYRLGKRIFNFETGMIAAFIVAVHPGFIFYDVKNLHPLGLGALCIASSIWLIILFKEQPSIKTASRAGFISGIGTLARGTVGSFFFLGIIWLLLKQRKNKRMFLLLLVMVSCFTAAIAPWTIRNYLYLKTFVPLRSTVGLAFWYGNNEHATGSSMTRDGKSMISTISYEVEKKLSVANEVGQNLIFKDEAIKFIKANPGLFLKLTLKKVFYFWWFSPVAGSIYPKLYTHIYKIFYLVFFLLFLPGIYFSLRNKKLNSYALLFLLLFFSLTWVHALTYVDCRHRWGIEPLASLFVAFSIYKIYNITRKNKYEKRRQADANY